MQAPQGQRPAWHKIALFVLVAAALGAAWRYTPLSELVTADNVNGWARAVRATWWAPAALVLAYTPAAILMFPRPLLTLIAVIAFGLWQGVAYAVAGILLSAMITYYVGRFLPQDSVRRLAGKSFEPAIKVLRNHSVLAIFALNQVPLPPFAVQGMIAGAVRINAWHYALGSLLGLAPTVLAWTVFGHQLAGALRDSSGMNLWIVAGVVVVLAVLSFFVRRWFARQASADAVAAPA